MDSQVLTKDKRLDEELSCEENVCSIESVKPSQKIVKQVRFSQELEVETVLEDAVKKIQTCSRSSFKTTKIEKKLFEEDLKVPRQVPIQDVKRN